MTSSALKSCSFVEYLALEETSETKHEYYDGEIFAMAGGTGQHGIIAGNCIGEARAGTKDRGCRVFTSDVKVLTASGLGTYPDASIVCEEPRYEDAKKTVLLNPLLIIEVLSDSTEAYDRGKKFEHYQSIESLQEYVLVSQDRAHVDRFTRQANDQWLLAGYSDLDSAVELPALACSIPMVEIYRGVEFPPASAPEAGEPSAEPAD